MAEEQDIFEQVRNSKGDARVANMWYITKVKELLGENYPGAKFTQDYRQNLTNRVLPGRMYMINYRNPVYKNTLPYYDMFPLIMPFEVTSEHLTAINFHYLHPMQRLILMDKLTQYKVGTGNDLSARIRADWSILKNFSKFREVKPAVKRYKRSLITGRYLFIQPEDWVTAIVLPTEAFRKAPKQRVYTESNRLMRQR